MVNDNWKTYLQNQGAKFVDNQGTELVTTFKSLDSLTSSSFIAPLTHQALLNIAGPDSAKFMQGQLTCDVNAVTTGISSLGAACTPKGRIYTSFRLIQQENCEPPSFMLRMRQNLIDSSIATLGKYIVFFKSKMTSFVDTWVGIGIHGEACDNLLTEFFGEIPTEINQATQNERGLLIRNPGRNTRYEAWLPVTHAQALWSTLAVVVSPASTYAWILEDIRAGIAEVSLATAETFIPQALNFQAINAVSFSKGCYTGQEIVARTQYRGKSKRLMLRAMLEKAPTLTPGTDLLDTNSQKNVATLVEAVRVNTEQQEVLLVVLDELAETSDWQFTVDNQNFTGSRLELPYQIDDIK